MRSARRTNNMTNFYLGSTYRKGYINTDNELIPQNCTFKSFPGETHVFEERESSVSVYQITSALESNIITEFDKTVISIIAVFGSAAITSKSISELLTLMDISFNKPILESSLKRLHRYHLINFSRFSLPDGKQSHTRIITLMKYGSQLAKNLGVVHRFNPIATASAEPYAIKSRAETTQLICNWLKNLPVENFSVRPVKVVNADAGAIIRPAATIEIWDETLFFEVPRRHDGWLEDFIGKLHRYELVFGKDRLPTIVINGEDIVMNLEISKTLSQENINADFLFTDDLAMFGPGFKSCLYTFDDSNNILRFNIIKKEREGV